MEYPKRKREVLSDSEHRLRKDRTDNLFEGYRKVREQGKERLLEHPGIGEVAFRDPFETGEEQYREEQSDSEDTTESLPDGFDPPPSSLGTRDNDSDSEGDPEVMMAQEALVGLNINGKNGRVRKSDRTRIVLTIRQQEGDGIEGKLI